MTSEPTPEAIRHRRVRSILLGAAEVDGDERRRFLETACEGDDQLRREVEALLEGVGVDTGDLLPASTSEPEVPTRRTIGPYRIERRLGSGGMGTVYAARAPATGTRVALKVLHPHLVGSDLRERFLREAEVGARVEHPNVVRTLDSGTDHADGEPLHYLVLEHVEGNTLAALLDAWGAIPEGMLREIARQAAEGLAAIHASGIVHRDLKPENLMLTDDHRLRIMDLGIARQALAESRLTATGQFVGSLLYAAPEQLDGGDVAPTTDLYSLGVVLYELATGTNPFHRASPGAVFRAQLEIVPRPLREAQPNVSAFFSAVIDTLIQKDPKRRFASADDLKVALDDAESSAWWRGRETPSTPRLSVRHDTPFHGRSDVLERLDAMWSGVRHGGSQVVQILGEGGLGKTRLLSEFATRCQSRDAHVLVPADDGGLCRALAHRLDQPDGDNLLEDALSDHATWVAAFRAWLRREVPPTGHPRLDLDTLATLMVQVLERLASDGPILLVLDDLDEADTDDLEVLVRTLRGTSELPLLTLLSASNRAKLSAALARLPDVARIELGRLDTEDAIALVIDVLGQGEPEAAEASRIAELGGGVPMFLLELARTLDADPTGDVQVPDSLREQVEHRLTHLEPDEAEILDLAAVSGLTFDPDVIASVREWSRLRVLATLGRLERRHGLVRSDGAGYRFDHPLVHEVVYQRVPPALRAEIHRLIANALIPSDWDGTPESLDSAAAVEIVHHQLRSSDPHRATDVVDRVIRHLEGTFRSDAVFDTVKRALEIVDVDPEVRLRWRFAHARHAHGKGPPGPAASLWETAIEEADALGDTELRVRARLSRGSVSRDVGDYDDALGWFEAANEIVGDEGPPVQRGLTLGWIGQIHWHAGRYEEAERVQREVIALGIATGSAELEARGSANLSVLLHETGRLDEAEGLARRAIELHRESGDRRNEAGTLGNLGNVLFDSGRLLDAADRYEGSVDASRRIAWRAGEAVGLLNLAEARLRLGETARAESALNTALSICRRTGLRREEGYVRHNLGGLEVARGDTAAAQHHLDIAMRIREELGDERMCADTRQLMGAVAELAGDTDAAIAHFDAALVQAVSSGEHNAEMLAQVRRAALTGEGGDAAAQRADELMDRLNYRARIETNYLVWRATGNRSYLDAAKAVLEREQELIPEERRAAFVDGVRLHAAILNA